MAKKKKFGALLEKRSANIPVVKQKAPKTISTNVSTGGIRSAVSGTAQQIAKSVRQKSEEERSSRMRQGISAVVRSSFNRQMSQPTRVQKSALKPLAVNALAPVKSTAQQTRSQQSKYLNTDLQRKGLNTPMTQLMAGQTNIGAEQGRALRAGMPTNSIVAEGWRSAPIKLPELSVQETYISRNGMPTNGLVITGSRSIDRGATDAEVKAREQYGYSDEISSKVDNMLRDADKQATYTDTAQGDHRAAMAQGRGVTAGAYQVADAIKDQRGNIGFGFREGWSPQNTDDTMNRQFGIDVDEDTQARIEQARSSVGYMTGMAGAQMSQYLLTRGSLSALGVVGKGAQATKAAKAAGDLKKARRAALWSEIGIDQAASVPLNLIDAMKEDNLNDMAKRFTLNQTLDFAFGWLTEGISIRRNPAFKQAADLHVRANEARAAGDNATADALDKASQKKLGEIPEKELTASQEEIRKRMLNYAEDEFIEPRIERAQNFADNQVPVAREGYVTSSEAAMSSRVAEVPDNQRYEWELAYDQARRNGSTQEEAFDFADASLEDAINRGTVRHSPAAEQRARAEDFNRNAERSMQDGYVASSEAVQESMLHDVPEEHRYEWQMAYDEIRRQGYEREDAIEYADASLEDALRRGTVRQSPAAESTSVESPSDRLAALNREREDILANVASEREDPLLSARNAREENNGLIGNDGTVRPAEERGEYGKRVIARYNRASKLQQKASEAEADVDRLLAEYDSPIGEGMSAEDDELWDATYREARERYNGYPDAEQRAIADADAAVMNQREIRLAEAVNRSNEARETARKADRNLTSSNREKVEEARRFAREQRSASKEVTAEPKAEPKVEPRAKAIADRKVATKSAEVPSRPKDESIFDATKRLMKNWGSYGNERSYREILRQYGDMSIADLRREKTALQKAVKEFSIDPDEAADRIALLDAITRERQNSVSMAAKKAEQSASSEVSDTWNDIPNITETKDELPDLTKVSPHRKESGIPKYSDQKTREEVLFRGETAKNSGTKETTEQVAQAPKRNQTTAAAKADNQPARKEQVDFDEFDVKEAERKGRETVNREKKASEKYGDYPGGMPKRTAEGEELSKGADTLYSRDDSVVHESVQLRGMEATTNEGASRKRAQGFNASLESAHERYKSDPRAFKERLKGARESVRKGEFPEGYTNMQDYFSDAAEYQKQVTRRLNSMKPGDDGYWDLVDEAFEFAEDSVAGGSQAGGGLQQYKAFVNAHPGVKATMIDKTLERLYKRFEKRLTKAGIKELKLPDEMRVAILTAETKEQASKAWADASIYVWRQIPASFKEKADFIRINAMLLNPKTHIRNILGNAIFLPMRELKNITGTGLEYVAYKAGILDKAARTKAIIPDGEAMKLAKDVRKNNPAIRGASRLLENLASGRPLESGMTFMAGRQNGNPVINGVRKFLDKTGNANAWLLEHEDFVFFNGAFDRQFGRITKARGLTVDDLMNNPKLLDDVTEAATEEALRATYRDESAAARMISKWKNPPKNASATRKAAGLALDAILPFTKTPINILRRAVDYSPAGAGKGIYHLARGMHDGNQKMIVRGLDQLASAIPGTGLAALGWFMAERDGVTAKLGSDKEDQFMKDLGKQNFSIVFNKGTDDEWSYTVDWAAPGCIPFFTGVALQSMSKDSLSFWEAADALEQMLEPMTEMSVMQGIKNTMETFQRESGGGVMQGLMSVGINTGLSYVGQFKPTLVSQTARMVDPVRRDTTSTAESATKRQVERWWNKQKAGIPGLSKTLNPYQNVWAEEESNTYNDDIPMRIVENYFSPGYAKKYKADSVDREILNVYGKDPSADGVIPTKFSKYQIGFDDGVVRFSEDDRANFIKVQGKVSKQDLRKLFDSKEYNEASLTEQQKMIANVYSNAKGEAKRDTLLKMGKDEWKVYTDDFDKGSRKKDYEDAKAAGIKADQYYELMTNKDWDLDENGSPMKSELALYLNADDNLTDAQRSVIFSKLASGNTKNPYEDGTAHTTDWQAEYDAKKNKDKNSSGSSKSGKSSGRSRSGGGGGSSKARAKTASEKLFASLQTGKAPTNAKGIEALTSVKGLSSSQKKALLKILKQRLEV